MSVKKQLIGIIVLVIAAAMIIVSAVFGSGILGGGKWAFIAGGLAIASMLGLGIATCLLVPETPKFKKVIASSKDADIEEGTQV